MNFPEQYRQRMVGTPYETKPGDPCGIFLIPGNGGRILKVIASDGADEQGDVGWEHVSVSLPAFPNKCPGWPEMCQVKDLFWDNEQCVVQYHPKKESYVNIGNVLHLWRWKGGEFPMPPIVCV